MNYLFQAVCGAAAGMLCKFAADAAVAFYRKKKNLEAEESRMERGIILLLMAVFGGCFAALFPLSAETVYYFLLMTLGMAVAITDVHHRRIPNLFLIIMLAVRICFGIPALLGAPGFPEFPIVQSLLGLVLCFAIFFAPGFFGKSVGAGDVKLAAVMGFCLGLTNALIAIVIMGILVIVWSMVQRRMPMLEYLKSTIPMGPFLAAGMVLVPILNQLLTLRS